MFDSIKRMFDKNKCSGVPMGVPSPQAMKKQLEELKKNHPELAREMEALLNDHSNSVPILTLGEEDEK